MDCYGLVREIHIRRGFDMPEYHNETEDNIIHQMVIKGRRLIEEIPHPEPFCIVLIAIHPKYITHMGVVLGDTKRFIHSTKGGVVIDRLKNWEPKIRGYYKWIGE